MLGKISVLKYYSRQVTTYHIIVLQLILLKTTEERIFTNSESNSKQKPPKVRIPPNPQIFFARVGRALSGYSGY